MGWSYAITCKSEPARDSMWAFLEEHFRPGTEVLGPLAMSFSRGYPQFLTLGEHLSYERKILQWVAVGS